MTPSTCVDALGRDKLDWRLLATLVTSFGSGPVGVNLLAAAVNEEAGTSRRSTSRT